MKTSYFGNILKIKAPLSISSRAPIWYNGPQFKALAPKYEFFSAYKAGELNIEGYISEFDRLVLAQLDPKTIYDQLQITHGPDVSLLCYEKPGEFCHRRLVARWFETELGVSVPELVWEPPKDHGLLYY